MIALSTWKEANVQNFFTSLLLFMSYLYDIGPDLETANLGKGLGPVLPDVEPSANFDFRLKL